MRRRSLLNLQKENIQLDESLVDAWIFSGLRNEDAPDSIVGEKGTPLTCYNFAWNEEGSGFKDGAFAQEEHAGTKEDPIPYVQNMILEKDKYYTLDGVLYICIQSTLTGYPNDLKDLVSIVQKVEE